MDDIYTTVRSINILLCVGIFFGLAFEMRNFYEWSVNHRFRQVGMMALSAVLAMSIIRALLINAPGNPFTYATFFPCFVYCIGVWWDEVGPIFKPITGLPSLRHRDHEYKTKTPKG